MKIVLVSPYDFAYPGGVNAHVSRLSESLAQLGQEVKIIAPTSRPGEMGSNFIPLGRPLPIPANGTIVRIPNPFSGIRLWDQARRILEEERFDIIHLHEPFLPPVPLAVLHVSNTINVGTFHASRRSSIQYRFWKPALDRWWVPKLQGRIAVSQPAMRLASHYFPGEYNIIPNGIDVAHFSADVAPIEEYYDGKLNILFVGRLEKRKGIKYLLGAYRRIKRDFPQSRLIVVGPSGEFLQDYKQMVKEKKIKDVVFTGYVPYEDLPHYYKTADIFCAPATGKESFGIVLLEAMAAGKPVIASNIEGYANLISPGMEGLLVKPKSEKSLAKALSYLLENKPLREKMGVMGRHKAEDYRWEYIASEIVDYYQNLLESSHKGK
jgi:phosphatidylinositol alpha-mannosyltransferase